MNWLQVDPEKDSFGAELLKAGVSKETLGAWSRDPQIKLSASSEVGSVFDALEDTDVDDCLKSWYLSINFSVLMIRRRRKKSR